MTEHQILWLGTGIFILLAFIGTWYSKKTAKVSKAINKKPPIKTKQEIENELSRNEDELDIETSAALANISDELNKIKSNYERINEISAEHEIKEGIDKKE